MNELPRRSFLKRSLIGGIASGFAVEFLHADDGAAPLQRGLTPPEIEGPFHPLQAQKDVDFDLTRIEGHRKSAEGKLFEISCQVLDQHGQPVPDATVELWQANHYGRYNHPHDRNPAKLDPHFQGWAIVQSGQQGGLRFKSILPGTYPVSDQWTRPPHLHFKVSKRGYAELTTQMYFPDQPLNKPDRLLQRKSPEEQERMIASRDQQNPDRYYFSLVIEKLT